MRKLKILFSVFLLFCLTLNCQNSKNSSKGGQEKKVTEKVSDMKERTSSKFLISAETSDVLYLNDSTPFYLMEKSPLKAFQNYRDIYDSYHEFAIVEMDMILGSFIPPRGNKYYVRWLLLDSTLYLGDIRFFDNVPDSVFPNNKQYRIMEELTQVKFDKEVARKYELPDSMQLEEGLMPAVWVSDVFLIKQVRFAKPRQYPEESYESWTKKPCIELVFQKGKLVSMREREDMY